MRKLSVSALFSQLVYLVLPSTFSASQLNAPNYFPVCSMFSSDKNFIIPFYPFTSLRTKLIKRFFHQINFRSSATHHTTNQKISSWLLAHWSKQTFLPNGTNGGLVFLCFTFLEWQLSPLSLTTRKFRLELKSFWYKMVCVSSSPKLTNRTWNKHSYIRTVFKTFTVQIKYIFSQSHAHWFIFDFDFTWHLLENAWNSATKSFFICCCHFKLIPFLFPSESFLFSVYNNFIYIQSKFERNFMHLCIISIVRQSKRNKGNTNIIQILFVIF